MPQRLLCDYMVTQLVVTILRLPARPFHLSQVLTPQAATVFPWATENTLLSAYLPATFPGEKSSFNPLLKGFMKQKWTRKIFQVAIVKVYWSIYYCRWPFYFLHTFVSSLNF